MACPNSPEARRYYRCAYQRFDDAQTLLQANRTNGSLYLAGDAVECILKALILEQTVSSRRHNMLQTFRGGRAHEYEWLIEQYRRLDGSGFPKDVSRSFTLVNTWTTDLRYQPGLVKVQEADGFLKAASDVLRWADGRL